MGSGGFFCLGDGGLCRIDSSPHPLFGAKPGEGRLSTKWWFSHMVTVGQDSPILHSGLVSHERNLNQQNCWAVSVASEVVPSKVFFPPLRKTSRTAGAQSLCLRSS